MTFFWMELDAIYVVVSYDGAKPIPIFCSCEHDPVAFGLRCKRVNKIEPATVVKIIKKGVLFGDF